MHPSHKTQSEVFELADQLILKGEITKARKALESVLSQKMSRTLLVDFARLARRADMAAATVRLLGPYVRRAGKQVHAPPTAAEKVEYGYALCMVGAVSEGTRLIESSATADVPDAEFLLAVAYFRSWNYQKSIPLLRAYADKKSITPYRRSVVLCNLGSALINEGELNEAQMVLQGVIDENKATGFRYLVGKAHYFLVEKHILAGEFVPADECLKIAKDHLGEGQLFDRVQLRIWQAISDISQSNTANARERLRAVRVESVQNHIYEGARNCDLFEYLQTRDIALYSHLWFGTPWPEFRKRIERLAGRPELESNYELKLGPTAASHVLDTRKPVVGFKPGSAPHRLLLALTTDFYRPVSIPEIFELLYPAEFYFSQSSSEKVRQVMRVFRKTLRSDHPFLDLQEKRYRYALSSNEGATLIVDANRFEPATNWFIIELRRWLPDEFSADEASRALKRPLRTVQRLLSEATLSGNLIKMGNKTATRYRHSASVLAKAA